MSSSLSRHTFVVLPLTVFLLLMGCGERPPNQQQFAGTSQTLVGDAQQAAVREQQRPVRWAIIASRDLQAIGLSDLLFAELSTMKRIDLVEREAVDSILQEQEISSLFGSHAIGRRLELGQMTKADRLLILQRDGDQETLSLRTAIVDTRVGATLRQFDAVFPEDSMERCIQWMIQLTADVQDEFADGVQLVVGIPPFVSTSLESKYDPLQKKFADLLGKSLACGGGVAVLSLTEATSIRQELDLAGGELGDIPTLFAEGQFKVAYAAETSEPMAALNVSLNDGKNILETVERQQIRLEDIPEELSGRIAESLLRVALGTNVPALSLEKREVSLARSADLLVGAGALAEASELRETILLLNPDNVEQRLTLLRESPAKDEARFKYPHVEYLLRHGLVDFEQGYRIFRMPYSYDDSNSAGPADTLPWADELMPSYVRDPYLAAARLLPLLFGLVDEQRDRRALGRSQNGENLIPVPKVGTVNRARYVRDLLNAADSLPESFRAGYLRPPALRDPLTREETVHLCQYLKNANDSECQRLAILLHHKYLTSHLSDRSDQGTILWEIEQLREEAIRLEASAPGPKPDDGDLLSERLLATIEEIEQQQSSSSGVPTKRFVRLANPVTQAPEPPIQLDMGITLTSLGEWEFPGWDPSKLNWSSPRLLKISKAKDIVWNQRQIYLLSRNTEGKLSFDLVYDTQSASRGSPTGTRRDSILHVGHDGRDLWVATANEGIHVISMNGDRLATYDLENGLPKYWTFEWVGTLPPDGAAHYARGVDHRVEWGLLPSDPSLKRETFLRMEAIGAPPEGHPFKYCTLAVLPTSPGHALAIGRFDTMGKTWIAQLSWDAERQDAKVEVLLSATRRLQRDRYVDAELLSQPEQIDLCFRVPWVCFYDDPENVERRVAIIGRHHAGLEHSYFPNHPLAVDLQTGEVTLLGQQLPQFAEIRGGDDAVSVHGSLVVVSDGLLEAYVRGEQGEYKHHQINEKRTQRDDLPVLGDTVLSPGLAWYRLDFSDDFHVEEVAGETIPPQHALARFVPSANFGIWAYGGTTQKPYSIDPEKPANDIVSPHADFVPAERLAKHDEAVERIRRYGGYVDRLSRCDVSTYGNFAQSSVRQERIAVCLTDEWTGGDEGLSCLKDLYGLEIVILLGAPISDQGMQHISQLGVLPGLFLVETNVTNEGLREVTKLKRLLQVHLESRPGETVFNDESIAILSKFRHLSGVSLYGNAFTDVSVGSLGLLRSLRHLRLLDTSISKTSVEQLHRTSRELRYGSVSYE